MNARQKIRTYLLPMTLLLAGMGRTVTADFSFGVPTNLGPVVNSPAPERNMCFSADGLELYFDSARPGTSGTEDLWVSRRGTLDEDWGAPVNLGPTVNSTEASWDWIPCLSPDGLSLYFASDRTGGLGGMDIWVTTRATRDDGWTAPENLGPVVNSAVSEAPSFIPADGLSMYFFSYQRSGGFGADDLWLTQRATADDAWGPPINLGPVVNGPMEDAYPTLSPDSLVLIFSSGLFPYNLPRSGGLGGSDLWWTRRASLASPWLATLNLGSQINTSYHENSPEISSDGSTLYFCSDRPGSFGDLDMWQVPILPIVDFNGDGVVDGKDVLTMTAQWGEGSPLCDIAPAPFGDGVVDLQDLIVLAKYVGTEVDDPTLLAHWAFDEAEGVVAHDSAGENNGAILGVPIWQPDAGKVGGALEFGETCFVVADAVLSPADGRFGVLAWIKGGGPEQAIVSQAGAANWLGTDASGMLVTELKSTGRLGTPLAPDTVITDGDWHRIGFTWDGSNRRLYVNDVLVAEDTQAGLAESHGALNIGRGKNMASASFWIGLIDDVRIYNRAVMP